MENKQKILNLMVPALQEVESLGGLKELQLQEQTGIVYAVFGGDRVNSIVAINAKMDSGLEMIRDVINHIV